MIGLLLGFFHPGASVGLVYLYNGVGVNRGRAAGRCERKRSEGPRNKTAHNFILQLPVKRASIRGLCILLWLRIPSQIVRHSNYY